MDKTLDFQSDFSKIVGTMKKEEKFHAMKLFCAQQKIAGKDNELEFNPQVLFATFGAKNLGIDNSNIYCVFRGKYRRCAKTWCKMRLERVGEWGESYYG